MQFIERVSERDIDLLLLEELHVATSFRTWFLTQILGMDASGAHFFDAWHSVCHPTLGESDLIILIEDASARRKALLIENKVDAPPQPDQANRYRSRGEEGINDGTWSAFHTCIIAPQQYISGTKNVSEYDVHLSYETIQDWFRQSGTADLRSAYKARMLQEAIEQNRRGYCPIPHAKVTQFWLDYWNLVNKEFHHLKMNKPSQIPAGSDWPEFRNPELGSRRRIVHKLGMGVVDLQIDSTGEFTEEIATRNRDVLDDGLEVVRTGKSTSFRFRVPEADRFGDLHSQLEVVRTGLLAASRLLSLSSRLRTE